MRSGFTAYFVLSPVNGSFATVAAQEWTCTTWRQHRGVRTTRLRRTLHAGSSATQFASTASHRTFVTIMIRPSIGWDARNYAADLPDRLSGMFLREGLDRLLGDLPVALLCRTGDATSSLRANGSRECAPDDRLREAIHSRLPRVQWSRRRSKVSQSDHRGSEVAWPDRLDADFVTTALPSSHRRRGTHRPATSLWVGIARCFDASPAPW